MTQPTRVTHAKARKVEHSLLATTFDKPAEALFTPIKVGAITLEHRLVMPAMTRLRADKDHIPTDMMITFYDQRSRTPGTLLISESTVIAAQAGGFINVPGIWNEAQIEGWKKIVDAVHSHKSFLFIQLWALGRAAQPGTLKVEGGFPYISASDVQHPDRSEPPRPMTKDEISQYIELYAQAAENAVSKAGADGVEVQGAYGHLIDQFIQDVTNKRTDGYGGSVENRCRFALEVIAAVVKRIGAERTGIRLSPWGTVHGMREGDPVTTFSYLVRTIKQKFPDLAYIHLTGSDAGLDPAQPPSHDFAREIWRSDGKGVFLNNVKFDRESAIGVAEETGDVIVMGRNFISNPDLPYRLKHSKPLTPWNEATLYTAGSPKGYIDYSFAHDSEPLVVQDDE